MDGGGQTDGRTVLGHFGIVHQAGIANDAITVSKAQGIHRLVQFFPLLTVFLRCEKIQLLGAVLCTKADGGKVLTSGGRVLSVTGIGATLREAVDKAYAAIGKISFDKMFYRKDIAHRAFGR